MKKIWYTLLVAFLPMTVAAQTTVVDHESPATTTTFQYFGNCDLEATLNNIIPSPASDAVNSSATVAEFIRRDCAATFAGYFSNPQPTQPVDLTTDNRINMKVWAPKVSSVTLKLEASTDGGPVWEQTQPIPTASGWVQVQFDATLPGDAAPFLSADGFTYAQPVIFFDLGAGAPLADEIYYWDDLETEFIFTLDQIDLPITFEDPTVDYTVTDFGGNVTTVGLLDPVDPLNTVASSLRPNLADFFAGTTMSTPAGLDNAIPIDNDNTRMSMRVYSPDAGTPVRLKVENAGDPAQSVETEVMTTVANAWETLIFDFANEVPGTAALNIGFVFNKASVFFNFDAASGTAGDKTYLWDDVQFIGGGGTGVVTIDLPITFDDPMVDYTAIDFGGGVTALAADPVVPSNTVTSFFKPSTADFFAGSSMSGASGLATPVALGTVDSIITVRVYSPLVGVSIKLKLEDNGDPTKSVETDALTSVANAWETLVFNFNNESPGTAALNPAFTFDKASIFMDFGNDGSVNGDQTYFYDDVIFGTPVSSCSSATPPTNQSHTLLSNRVQLDWDPQALAVACQVKGQRLPTGPSPSVNILGGDISTVDVPFNVAGAGTTWTWQVRCACSISPLDVTAFSAFGDTFSVPAARVANVVKDVTITNPVSDLMTISANVEAPVSALVQVLDMQGRTVATRRINVEAGLQTVSMDLSQVANGIYFVNAPELGLETAKQIVVQH